MAVWPKIPFFVKILLKKTIFNKKDFGGLNLISFFGPYHHQADSPSISEHTDIHNAVSLLKKKDFFTVSGHKTIFCHRKSKPL